MGNPEVKNIIALVKGDASRAWDIVNAQLQVVVLRAQVLLSLSGIVITVTGFSGRTIAQTSTLARSLVGAGIIIVLASACVAIVGVLRLDWLTRALGDELEATLTRMLAIRDKKSKALGAASIIFVLGFACYCLAIAQMLLATPSGP